ncbi:MAG: 4-(cytidine 5'-diphospho)-2-C-methyl-D-erythritol kinase [Lachnospiraceae bacterium]|nr:4-(cytidine 5'-diphospho)-2-C-methyl-D-erythritol kinase [Lachnospiraceae bacterium]MBO7599946.1 4-(cytidine 5'-diphospho)-2-C-methyl-D-erythritol kinase [Lachnospiraceae bacterium]
MIKEKAYAKINLSLDVLGRRENGYHDVKMIMQSIDLHDELTLEKTDDGIVLLLDNAELKAEEESGKENIITKAAKAFFDRTKIKGGVKINLVKNIPIAAGMAGGSTDAAATLRGLNRLYETGLSTEELEKIGVLIGADVPFCIEGGTKLSEGIGEILTKLPSPSRTEIVICKPDINVSTKEVYERFDELKDPFHPDVDAMAEALKAGNAKSVAKLLGNSLEDVTKSLHPIIGEIEELMEENGATRAIMSGSGPTVYAIVAEDKKDGLVTLLKERYPAFYVKGHYYD